MVNHVGKTTQTLSTNLGETTTFIGTDTIVVVSGEIGLGFLLFDANGTLGVVTEFTDTTNFVVTTHALSIDIEKILNLSY